MPKQNHNRPNTEQSARRWRGCEGKTSFPSKGKAIGRASASAIVSKPDGPTGMTVYRCRVCHRWHLSTKL
jgi:hypothetical protein